MTTNHTPTPYAFDQEADNSTDFWIFQANGPTRIAAECSEADAAFIVRACNAHDEMVAALRAILPYAENETQGLWACVRDDDAIADEANAAEEALTAAYTALAKVA